MIKSEARATARRVVRDGRRAQILAAGQAIALREGLDGVTLRAVARESDLSPGLLLFHFESAEALLLALLDAFLASIGTPHHQVLRSTGTAFERLAQVTDFELSRLARERAVADVFFEFWVRGLRHPEIRRRMRTALRSYRESLLPLSAEVVKDRPELFAGVTAEGLASMVVASIQGSVLQAVLDPRSVDLDQSCRTFFALSRAMAAWKPERPVRRARTSSSFRSRSRP